MKPGTPLMATVVAVAAAAIAPVHAQSPTDHSAHHAPTASAAADAMSDGEVRKIDKAQAKLTLRHGPIKNLDMPSMTMVFKVSDPRLLEGLNPGDKVRFSAANVQGAVTVTAIQVVK